MWRDRPFLSSDGKSGLLASLQGCFGKATGSLESERFTWRQVNPKGALSSATLSNMDPWDGSTHS